MSVVGLYQESRADTAKKRITWFIWDLPPEFVSSGPYQGQGYADKFLQFFIQQLPEYQHSILAVNVPRWSLQARVPGTCTAHLWGGFYPELLAYSKAYTFTPPHILIFNKKYEQRFGPQGTVLSIEELLKQRNLKLLLVKVDFNKAASQSRYPVLYQYLKPHLGDPNLVEHSIHHNFINLDMLEKGRGDYTIGYPSTIASQKRTLGVVGEFISYRIKEHNLYKKVHVACFNDAFGREVIKKVDRSLTKDVLLKFLEYHEEWNNKDPYFRQTTIDYFIKGLNLPNVIDWWDNLMRSLSQLPLK